MTTAATSSDQPKSAMDYNYNNVRAAIMVVEDDADLMFTLTGRLHHANFKAIPAPDGMSALAVAKHWPISAAIVDLNLPIMSGYEVIERLQESGIPTLTITASADPLAPQKVADLGCNSFLRKPFTGAFLLAKLNELLEQPISSNRDYSQ